MVFCFVQTFFFGQHESQRKRDFFSRIRLYDKHRIRFFFPPPKSEYFFQQHWESEYFFREKPYVFKHVLCAISGAVTACPSAVFEFTLNFQWSSCYSIFRFMCMFCRSLFAILYFLFCPLCCLIFFFFDIRILITPLVSSNSSLGEVLKIMTGRVRGNTCIFFPQSVF